MEICKGINESAKVIFENNKEKGFWDNERNIGEMLMLVTSELGEAMEAHRKGRKANLIQFDADRISTPFHELSATKTAFEDNIKDSFEDEIADSIIRLLDMCGGLGIDIERHINLKVEYNKTREKLHGKKY